MKVRDKMLFGIGILLLMVLHWYLFPSKEGFLDDPSAYDALRSRLQKDLGPYCKISTFVRNQVNEMQKGMGGSASDISQMYTGVYQCTDQLASARPSCAIPNKTGMRFVPCSVYMDLPEWSDEDTAVNALRKIKDDLPERLRRESEWFAVVIKKIKEGLAAGANPPTLPDKSPKGSKPTDGGPSLAQMNAFKEGFAGQCSAEANKYLRRKALEDEAKNCTPGQAITPASEIARVNRLLEDPSVEASVKQSSSMMTEMLKLQSDLEKLKNGTLYEWQQDGPKKSYAKFEGGDRTKSFLFSLQQNQ